MKKELTNIKTRLGNYQCAFESNRPEKGYTVTVPKLKGVVTFGETLHEAKIMAKEAIELHCECLLEKGIAEIKLFRKRATKTPVRV